MFFVQVFEMGHVLCMYGLLKAIIVKIGKYFALLENDVHYNSTTIIWEALKKNTQDFVSNRVDLSIARF